MRQKVSSAISKYFRYPRHLAALIRHAGLKKTANVLLVESERLRGRSVLRGKPYYYFVDPCNVCNLRCPLCPTGNGELDRAKGMLKFADYQIILDKIAPYAVEISLHNWGEPLLNKDIFKIISTTRARGIATNMSSNLSIEKENIGEQIVKSGLEYLIVSLDGTTQDVYEQYRVRGELDLVMHNLRDIIAAKKRLRSKTPTIEWQFLVFKHNEHQMAAAEELAPQIGVDKLRFRSPGFPLGDYKLKAKASQQEAEDRWMPTDPAYWELHPGQMRKDGYLWDEPCYYLYRSMTVNPGGGVAACCIVYKDRQDFGNLVRDDLATIWNNQQYQRSRALFGKNPADRAGTVCDGCFLFKRPLGVSVAQGLAQAPLIAEDAIGISATSRQRTRQVEKE
ncbi:MAG: SPASM domain-containing protein [Roseiflexaceae bacterium]|nr:SPASM domain-containing protein [Roseiflexaceae bacterium]